MTRTATSHCFQLLGFALLAVLGAAQTWAEVARHPSEKGPVPRPAPVQPVLQFEASATNAIAADIAEPESPGRYIVQLVDPSIAAYRGGIPGLGPTNPDALGRLRLDLESDSVRAYREYLTERQLDLQARIETLVGPASMPDYRYQTAFNGLAIVASEEEATRIATLPGVRRVIPESVQYPDTDVGPEFVGATRIWDDLGARGEGVVVGVIDTGIWPEHPSFAAVGDDGYAYVNPLGSGNYLHVCDPLSPLYDPTFPCNDKLIGAWYAASDFSDARDHDSHGSHTASTAAGNLVTGMTLTAPTLVLSGLSFSGVAPHATLVSYRACGDGCPETALVAAIDAAVADGVDVINYSIGGDPEHPWTNPTSQALLDAFAAGVHVATSAGNDGPDEGSLGSPGESPWMTTVAASTHDRAFPNQITFSGGASPLGPMTGLGFTSGYGPAPIVYAADAGDAQCLDPFPAATWSGEIVICDRGWIERTVKAENVLAGGAGGLVLLNFWTLGTSIHSDPYALPAVNLSYTDGEALKAWLTSGSGHVATISGVSGSLRDSSLADVMAGLSSRGPAPALQDVLKPDVTAPGMNVLAAENSTEPSAAILSGTSMSSPHVAGALALLHSLHPDWSPAETRSALMTTALASGFVDNVYFPAPDAFDFGSGRIRARLAADAGLLLDESHADFLTADPAGGGDPTTLNLASMAKSACVGCSWSRTVTNSLDVPTTWHASIQNSDREIDFDVSPTTLALSPGGSGTLTVTTRATETANDTWHHATLLLRETSGLAPDARLPIALEPVGGSDTRSLSKSVDTTDAVPGDHLTYSLTLTNRSSSSASFSLSDPIPPNSSFVPGTLAASSGTSSFAGNEVTWSGTVAPASIAIVPGSSPYGYFPLSTYYSPLPCPTNCDDGGFTFSDLNFTHRGVHYDSITMSINGTLEPGALSGYSSSSTNQHFPDPAVPNNLLAPFWTDLDLTSAGAWYMGTLCSDGSCTRGWHVFEWENAPLRGEPSRTYTFQVWIETGDADTITFVYGDLATLPAALTVGAENEDGLIGDNYYYNGAGTAPAQSTDLVITQGPDSSVTVSFQVEVGSGPEWVVNVATMSGGAEPVIATAATRIDACDPGLTSVHDTEIIGANNQFHSCGSLVIGPNVDILGATAFQAPNGVTLLEPVSMHSGCAVEIGH